MSSSGEEVKPLSVILVEINQHTDEAQLEKLRFLARGLFQTRHVDDADSVPSLYRTMEQHQDTSKRAVFYLHYMLEKASVKPECTNQLSSYVEQVQAHGKPPMFYFREMLLDVAESFNQRQFKSFRNVVEVELKANVNNFENALRVFQRLIYVGTLTMAEESLDQLKQWLVDSGMGSTAEEVVQRYKNSLEGELYLAQGVCTWCIASSFFPTRVSVHSYNCLFTKFVLKRYSNATHPICRNCVNKSYNVTTSYVSDCLSIDYRVGPMTRIIFTQQH